MLPRKRYGLHRAYVYPRASSDGTIIAIFSRSSKSFGRSLQQTAHYTLARAKSINYWEGGAIGSYPELEFHSGIEDRTLYHTTLTSTAKTRNDQGDNKNHTPLLGKQQAASLRITNLQYL
ncbi:hypothetical protein ACHAO4_000149 [Trichoderma viride]